jgi:hypothetical protein
MVLVRKTELACRNGWDQDLWEPANGTHTITSPDIPMPGEKVQDIRARNSAEYRAPHLVVPAPVDDPTDRVTSISMQPHAPVRTDGPRLATSRSEGADPTTLDPRDAVREARRRRQEHRDVERRQLQLALLKHAGTLLEDADEPHRPTSTNSSADRDVVAPYTIVVSTRSEKPDRLQLPPRGGVGVPSVTGSAPDAIPPIKISATPDRFASRPANDGRHGSAIAQRLGAEVPDAHGPVRTPAVPDRTEPLPTDDVRARVELLPEWQRPRPTSGQLRRDEDRHDLAIRTRPASIPPPIESRPVTWTHAGGRVPVHVPSGSGENRPLPADPIETAVHIRRVVRCCATCRDFKQIGDGRRGWCTNAYAFPERRMVESNELACRSSIGICWLPHDDLWLERADTTHHGRPTPLLDVELGQSSDGKHGMGPRTA